MLERKSVSISCLPSVADSRYSQNETFRPVQHLQSFRHLQSFPLPVRVDAQDARAGVLSAVGAVATGDAAGVPAAVRAAAPHPRRIPESLRAHRPQRAGRRHVALRQVGQKDR